MKITAIKQQVRRQGRYSIFVEGKYAFSLSESALLGAGLATGQDISETRLRELKQESADDKIYHNTLAYAVLRPRSTWEIEQYLLRKNCSPPLIKTTLNKLSVVGLLDDETFARSWIANRRLLKPMSRRRLLQELRAKRVPDEIAERALTEDTSDEKEVLLDLVARKRKQTRYQDDQKLMQYLAGQGFNYGDIKEALNAEA
ncbi:MAG TPA: RecX family transcriptional regulator [Candidatus Saccharimonadales bacterium]|nr:RecX family transcriptional regulator [Candidatus Saccharimonadales bacterium]